MTAAFAIASLLFLGAAAILFLRVTATAAELDRLFAGHDAPIGLALQRVLREHILEALGPSLDHRGIGEVAVRAREPDDRERTLADLIDRIRHLTPPQQPTDHEDRAKAVLQLAHTLELDDAAVGELLAPLIADLAQVEWLGRRVTRIDTVRKGELVDPGSMWPLSSGTRVRVPLGLVVRDDTGKVLSRAKVYCG